MEEGHNIKEELEMLMSKIAVSDSQDGKNKVGLLAFEGKHTREEGGRECSSSSSRAWPAAEGPAGAGGEASPVQ